MLDMNDPNIVRGGQSKEVWMLVDLTPGPDLDAAVAKACGIDIARMYGEGPFSPSTDFNAAREAGNKAGLWDKWCLIGNRDCGDFVVFEVIGAFEEVLALGEGPTPALAICAAILNLEGAK
jgi:hypothetical protein